MSEALMRETIPSLCNSEADKVRCGIEHFKELGVPCEVVVSGLDV